VGESHAVPFDLMQRENINQRKFLQDTRADLQKPVRRAVYLLNHTPPEADVYQQIVGATVKTVLVFLYQFLKSIRGLPRHVSAGERLANHGVPALAGRTVGDRYMLPASLSHPTLLLTTFRAIPFRCRIDAAPDNVVGPDGNP